MWFLIGFLLGGIIVWLWKGAIITELQKDVSSLEAKIKSAL